MDDKIKYYVRAQNDDAMILEPRRAEYEFFDYTIETVSGNAELAENTDINTWFSIYPNPATDVIHIAGDLGKVHSIHIHDASGRLVYQSIRPSLKSISIAEWSSGLYALSFFTGEGVVLKKLVVEN